MKDRHIDKETFDRYLIGTYSEEDASYVRDVFSDEQEEENLEKVLQKQFDEVSFEKEVDNEKLDQVLYKIHYEINTKCKEGSSRIVDDVMKWTLRLAGVIIVPLIVFFGIHTYKKSQLTKNSLVEIIAPANGRVKFNLPDGTNGWLNSGSSIQYNGDFNTKRNVTLLGEAVFEVFENDKKPFVVSTNGVFVTVLGTRFNIASYDNEETIEVVLEEGKLLFSFDGTDDAHIMNPNEKVSYNKISRDFVTEVVQAENYLNWIEGKLVFRNDPIDVVARRLARWYNIDVEINDALAENGPKLRATFIDENLEDVLDLLKLSLPIEYRIDQGSKRMDDSYAKSKVIITPIAN